MSPKQHSPCRRIGVPAEAVPSDVARIVSYKKGLLLIRCTRAIAPLDESRKSCLSINVDQARVVWAAQGSRKEVAWSRYRR